MSAAEHSRNRRKIMLVDDHPILRNGLATLIDNESDLVVCCQLGSATEAMGALDTCTPDLIRCGYLHGRPQRHRVHSDAA